MFAKDAAAHFEYGLALSARPSASRSQAIAVRSGKEAHPWFGRSQRATSAFAL